MSEHNGDSPELSDAEKIRLRAAVSDITEMSIGLRAGTATPGDVEGAFNRLKSCDIDRNALVDAMHIPPGAGPSLRR